MNDHELLELAAKAAGIDLKWGHEPSGEFPYYSITEEGKDYETCFEWNPLIKIKGNEVLCCDKEDGRVVSRFPVPADMKEHEHELGEEK